MTGRMSRGLRSDNEGVTATVEYILTFIIAAGVFTLLVFNFNSLFINTPQYVVSQNQLADIGNDVSTKVIDTYLVAPDNGSIRTYFNIPNELASGYTYNISVQLFPQGTTNDREVVASTDGCGGIFVNTTLSGANVTIPINGSTSSTWAVHEISYSTKT